MARAPCRADSSTRISNQLTTSPSPALTSSPPSSSSSLSSSIHCHQRQFRCVDGPRSEPPRRMERELRSGHPHRLRAHRSRIGRALVAHESRMSRASVAFSGGRRRVHRSVASRSYMVHLARSYMALWALPRPCKIACCVRGKARHQGLIWCIFKGRRWPFGSCQGLARTDTNGSPEGLSSSSLSVRLSCVSMNFIKFLYTFIYKHLHLYQFIH